MVGRDPQMRRVFLDHLQDGVEHTYNRAERPVLALGKSTQSVEMAEQLVRTVDEMNDHCIGLAQAAAKEAESPVPSLLRPDRIILRLRYAMRPHCSLIGK